VDYETRSSVRTLLEMLSACLAEIVSPVEFLRALLEQAVERTGALRGAFVEVPDRGEPEYRVLHRIRPRDLEGTAGMYSRGVVAKVCASGSSICIGDAGRHPEFMHRESIARLKFASILCVPIHVGDRIAAVVHLEHDERGHFGSSQQTLLEWLAEIASPMLGVLQEEERILVERRHLRAEAQESRRRFAEDWSFRRFVGRSSAVRELEASLPRIAATSSPILILGETGTGKSILARILHASSPRAEGPFVTVACPNLDESRMQAELFGTREGAYTDARNSPGKVQVAEAGTLFLDEIGDLPMELQPRLLQLLQSRTYSIVGDPRERTADVHIVAATNRDLAASVQSGQFRRDLYERLNYVPVEIAPLRARKDDIPDLLRHCLDQIPDGRWIQIADDAVQYLVELDFAWPGNVRNLEQLAARIVIRAGSGTVSRADVEREMRIAMSSTPQPAGAEAPGEEIETEWPAFYARQEKKWLQARLRDFAHLPRAEQARRLQMSVATLHRKLGEHGLTS